MAFAATVVAGVMTVAAAGQDEGAPPAPAGAAGMVIYRDPATGALGGLPAGARTAPAMRQAQPPPVERPGTSPAGGVLLEGLPWNTFNATADPRGSVATHCERHPASGASQP